MPKYLIELERSQKYKDMINALTEVKRYLDGWTPPGIEETARQRSIPIEHFKMHWAKSIEGIIDTLQPLSDATSKDDGMKESCSNCRNWQQLSRTCRRDPGIPISMPSFFYRTGLLTLRPHAESDSWCSCWTQGGIK